MSQDVPLPLSDAELTNGKETTQIKYDNLGLTLECIINTDKDKIIENINTNIRRGHEQVWMWKEQDTKIAICAGGPSLLETLDELREAQAQGVKIIALANAAHVLKEHGIHYSAHVLLDAKPNNANFIMDEDTTYFIASQCDPSVFDKAEKTGNKIFIYHAINNEEEFTMLGDVYDKWIPVQAGATIALRAIRLFNILGYHKFHMFGFDSCKLGEQHHAYEQPDADKQPTFKLEVNERMFWVTPWMINQAMEFMKVCKTFGQNWEMKVHGDGLIAHLVKEGGGIVHVEEQ